MENKNGTEIRFDFKVILDMVKPGSKVLDLGCGNGELLELLRDNKNCIVSGVDIHEPSVIECMTKGITVIQADISEGLLDLADESYDYVILSRTLQQIQNPKEVVAEMLRVGKNAIVSFPNFSFWRIRLRLLFTSTLPVSNALPYHWFDTPNIRVITLKDFVIFCMLFNFKIAEYVFLKVNGKKIRWFPSWFSEYSIFLLTKR